MSSNSNRSFGHRVFITSAPEKLRKEFDTLLTTEAIEFLADLVSEFDTAIDRLYATRSIRKYELIRNPKTPKFSVSNEASGQWTIAPVGKRLVNRHLDLGDVSPANTEHFVNALRSDVQGIQVDFDDGHCPIWRNQIIGLHNVYQAVRNEIPKVPGISSAPILMLRPRAWNMLEHNMTVNGKEVPGPLFDFGLLMFHNATILCDLEAGPCFYLSKLEGANEARLWNDIFQWSQKRLGLPYGTIKACVLIENILSAYEMEDILYSLKDHSLGLNCGIWDYAASIINKFGNDKSFVLPDRNKYVNTSRQFLKSYMELTIRVCHAHGAHATGGMAAALLPENANSGEYKRVVENVRRGKLAEIDMGVDGFMVYDTGLVPYMNDLWKTHGGPFPNQIKYPGTSRKITESDLLTLPVGGITRDGLERNIAVSILFIYNWLRGVGNFSYKRGVEDSATAEISRSQIWQWIRHGATIEDDGTTLTRYLVDRCSIDVLRALLKEYATGRANKIKMHEAHAIFTDIVNHREFPDFITTYLNDTRSFRKISCNL